MQKLSVSFCLCACVCAHTAQPSPVDFGACFICIGATCHGAILCCLLVQSWSALRKLHTEYPGIIPRGSVLWFNHSTIQTIETDKSPPKHCILCLPNTHWSINNSDFLAIHTDIYIFKDLSRHCFACGFKHVLPKFKSTSTMWLPLAGCWCLNFEPLSSFIFSNLK